MINRTPFRNRNILTMLDKLSVLVIMLFASSVQAKPPKVLKSCGIPGCTTPPWSKQWKNRVCSRRDCEIQVCRTHFHRTGKLNIFSKVGLCEPHATDGFLQQCRWHRCIDRPRFTKVERLIHHYYSHQLDAKLFVRPLELIKHDGATFSESNHYVCHKCYEIYPQRSEVRRCIENHKNAFLQKCPHEHCNRKPFANLKGLIGHYYWVHCNGYEAPITPLTLIKHDGEKQSVKDHYVCVCSSICKNTKEVGECIAGHISVVTGIVLENEVRASWPHASKVNDILDSKDIEISEHIVQMLMDEVAFRDKLIKWIISHHRRYPDLEGCKFKTTEAEEGFQVMRLDFHKNASTNVLLNFKAGSGSALLTEPIPEVLKVRPKPFPLLLPKRRRLVPIQIRNRLIARLIRESIRCENS